MTNRPDTSIIALSPPDHRLDRRLLDANGGFVWWYLDLVDEAGNGLVLIWSYGLPFLPGYAQAAREGRAPEPRRRPSINLSVYDRGELDFYLLQELAPDEAIWSRDEDSWSFGDCRMQRRVEDGRVKLEIDIDCPVDGSEERISGRIELDGVARKPCGAEVEPGELPHHDWTPRVGPARGVAELRHGAESWHIEGRAYHDRNGGSVPQHELGIHHWIWGRVPLEDRELIYYLFWETPDAAPTCFAMSIDADGRTELYDKIGVELSEPRKNMGGLRWWPTLELTRAGQPWLSVEHRDVVDSGPFYMRYILEATTPDGQQVRGVGELCEPDRVDMHRHRPLVRMRVHDLDGPNSMWLPLFTGPKRGRVSRLLKSFLPGGR